MVCCAVGWEASLCRLWHWVVRMGDISGYCNKLRLGLVGQSKLEVWAGPKFNSVHALDWQGRLHCELTNWWLIKIIIWKLSIESRNHKFHAFAKLLALLATLNHSVNWIFVGSVGLSQYFKDLPKSGKIVRPVRSLERYTSRHEFRTKIRKTIDVQRLKGSGKSVEFQCGTPLQNYTNGWHRSTAILSNKTYWCIVRWPNSHNCCREYRITWQRWRLIGVLFPMLSES